MHAVLAPREHVNDESVLLVEWLVKDGEQVQQGHPLVTMETSKATLDIEAPIAGYVRLHLPKGTEVKVGEVLCYIADSLAAPPPQTGGEPQGTPVESSQQQPLRPASVAATRFSRQASALLKQYGLNEEQFAGNGLITGDDVLRLVNGQKAPEPRNSAISSHIPARIEELPRRKRVEARNLMAGQNTVSSLVSVICSTRGLKAAARTHPELRGGPLPLILHETARLLRKYPVFNSFYDGGNVHYYDSVNIGIAMDAERGLKVPVIANSDGKTIAEIRMELENFVLSYMDDTLPVQALADGTFTVTDLSGEDVHSFMPLINQGQGAILGVGAEYFPPGSSEGVFNLILSFDHRLTEGRAAACFLRDLRERLESYERALNGDKSYAVDGEQICCGRCLRTASELNELNVPLLNEIVRSGQSAPICANCVLGY